MRSLLTALVFATGCISSGHTSGVSPEAAERLETIGPALDAHFQLDGSSLSLAEDRQLDVRARSDSLTDLPAEARAIRVREMADWLWQHYGLEAGLEGINIRPVRVETTAATTSAVYRFSRAELTGS